MNRQTSIKRQKRRQLITFFRASHYVTSAPLHNLEVTKNGVECTEITPRDSLEHTVYIRNMENIHWTVVTLRQCADIQTTSGIHNCSNSSTQKVKWPLNKYTQIHTHTNSLECTKHFRRHLRGFKSVNCQESYTPSSRNLTNFLTGRDQKPILWSYEQQVTLLRWTNIF